MRTILMLVVLAAGCTDEPMDPHELAGDCSAAWGGVVTCEIGCAAGPADPPLVVDGTTCPLSVVEYDGQLGACLANIVDGKSRIIFAELSRC